MKKQLRSITFVAAMLAAGSFTHAQIQHGGSPVSLSMPELVAQEHIPVMTMPTFDKEAMLAEDAINDQNKIGPWRFAKNFMVNYTTANSGVWENLEKGGRVWRIAVESRGAYSLNIEFSEYNLPKGATVFLYNKDYSQVLGSFTHENNKTTGILATAPLGGDRMYIEYFEPADAVGQGALAIGRVSHDYRGIMGYARKIANEQSDNNNRGFNDSGSCNNNVICPEGDNWRCQIKSVAIITVNGNGACTGTLMNNVNEDETPYFLSADHCGTNSSNWVFVFNWESAVCTPSQNLAMTQSVSGASNVAANGGSDFALHLISSNVPQSYDPYYSGWDATGTAPTASTAIHHPSGDLKKISFDTDPATQATFGGAQCWNISNWEDGTTEPGSSGSGLWNQNGHLIGQLYGGSASCSSISDDYYGRLDVSWNGSSAATRLKDHLDPNNTGTLILDGKGFGACAGVTFQTDAAITGIDGINGPLCNVSTITPTATLKNNGTDPITSADVNYNFNNGSSTGTIPFTGTLAAGSSTTITLPTFTLVSGANSLTVTSSNPNSTVDQNPSNDASTDNFTAVLNGQTVTVDIIIDNYGEETTWQITDASNNVMASGGPYSNFQDGTLHSTDVCLEEGVCYTFTIDDDYGDGICCGYGNGSYTVSSGATIFAQGGEFTDTESTNFCVTVGIEEQVLVGMKLYPNPTNGNLTVDLSKVDADDVQLLVYSLVGQQVINQRINSSGQIVQVDLSNASEGMYFVEIRSDKGKAIEKVLLQK